jgi:hypothetical protein
LSNNKLNFTNKRQEYGGIEMVNLYTGINQPNLFPNTLKLNEFTTLFAHATDDHTSKIAEDNVEIFIDDTIGWKQNQSFQLNIQDFIDLGVYSLTFYTDIKDKLGAGEIYSKIIKSFSKTDLEGKSNIEIICINPESFNFITRIY